MPSDHHTGWAAGTAPITVVGILPFAIVKSDILSRDMFARVIFRHDSAEEVYVVGWCVEAIS